MAKSIKQFALNYWAHVFVFIISLIGLFSPQFITDHAAEWTLGFLSNFNWLILLSCTAFLVLCFYLCCSRFGHIRLGKDDERPEFSFASWLAMLFAAGMGVGLVLWGTAEPLLHFSSPPPNATYEAGSIEAARQAMVLTHLHWALHPWGIYCLSALVIAYFCFRKDYPLLPSSPLRSQKGMQAHPVITSCVDGIALIAVAFGVLSSIGFGVMNIQSSISQMVDIPLETFSMYMIIVAVLAACYLTSAATGINKGIKILSDINMSVCILLMAFIMLAGPTLFILETFVSSLGDYLSNFVKLSFHLRHYSGAEEWTENWTLTYFLWWVAWGPFVGAFIARISRGRTIREFVLGVVLVPSLFSILWFSTFGGATLYMETHGMQGFASAALEKPELGTYLLLQQLPFSAITQLVAVFLMFVFLITSADSGSYVMGIFSSRGNPKPSRIQRIIWGGLIAVLTLVVLRVGGGSMLLKTLSATGAVLFLFILAWQAVRLVIVIRRERVTVIHHPVPAATKAKDRK